MNLNQITVPSLILSKSIPFYQKLGLKLIVNSHPGYARFNCPNGDATFSIQKVNALPKGEGIFVYFECSNLDEYVDELIAKDIKFAVHPLKTGPAMAETGPRCPGGWNEIA